MQLKLLYMSTTSWGHTDGNNKNKGSRALPDLSGTGIICVCGDVGTLYIINSLAPFLLCSCQIKLSETAMPSLVDHGDHGARAC